MPPVYKKKPLLVFLHILSLLLLARLAALAFNETVLDKNSLDGLELASKVVPDDAIDYYRMGLIWQYDLINSDAVRAVEYYRAALRKNPLLSKALLMMAHAYQAAGRRKEAFKAIDAYYRLRPNNPDSLWEVAVFYIVNSDRPGKAMGYFRRLLDLRPGIQRKIYDICYQMNLSNAYIMNHLIKDSTSLYPSYLRYLISNNRLDEALEFYNKAARRSIDEKLKTTLCDSLIRKGRYHDAFLLWREMEGTMDGGSHPEVPLLSNGGFEGELKNGCFGWVVGRADGVRIYTDGSVRLEGRRSLGISFSGKYNVGLEAIRQLVLLAPGNSYTLKAHIRTEGLTTTNGLFFEARGYDCRNIYARSDVITGTNAWRPLELGFSLPRGCEVVKISLRRQKSRKFNNKIKGNAWVDGVELTRVKTGN